MKILYDFQAFSMQMFGGVSRYFYELMNQFGNDSDLTWELPFRYSNNKYLRNLKQLDGHIENIGDGYQDFLKGLNFRGKHRLYCLKNKLFPYFDANQMNKKMTTEKLREGEYDIFHPTYYDNYFLEFLLKNKPFVLTIYDMIHEIYPECFSLTDPTPNYKKILVQKASRIIAISETTRRDLVNIFGVPEDKITVIYLGNSLTADGKPTDSNFLKDLPAQYLLFVGNRHTYKNFYFFVRSVSELLLENPKLHLVSAGHSFSIEENRFFKNLGLVNKIRQYAVDDTHLAYLYQNARAFVFPSLYEGFGLPVLEAFSCNCPAILSTGGSLPEIGGDAAVYFDPKNSGSIREAVSRVINDETLRRELIQKGETRANDFSWEKTAQMTKQVYAEVMECSKLKNHLKRLQDKIMLDTKFSKNILIE